MQTAPPKADAPKRKRRWFQFRLRTLFVVVTVAAAAAAWIFSAKTYTVSALIRIVGQPTVRINGDTRSSIDVYRGTQIQLLTSDFVLTAALRNISQLEFVKQQKDPVQWLAKALQVESPGNSEILRVSLSTPQKADSVAIVNAVVAAYMTEVVDKERADRVSSLAELDKVYAEKEAELRSKRMGLKRLTEASGDGSQSADRMQMQITDLRRWLDEARRAEMQAELRIAHLKHDVDGLDKQSDKFKAAKAETEAAEVDREFWHGKCAPLIEELHELQKRLDRQEHESIDVEMMRGEIESLKRLAQALYDERQRTQIELNSRPPITVLQPAQ